MPWTSETRGAAVGGSEIHRTTDGGETWTRSTRGLGSVLRGVSFGDRRTGAAVGRHGEILWTTDGGDTWGELESGTVQELRSVSVVDAGSSTVVGDTGLILRSVE
jgi:photosystem II stability/assembly factor-like uncharacterized protein